MHPEFISRISTPASLRKPLSMPISPNSFSMRTTCSPLNASLRSFWMSVVLPAPRKPEIISIFVILSTPVLSDRFFRISVHIQNYFVTARDKFQGVRIIFLLCLA